MFYILLAVGLLASVPKVNCSIMI